MEKQGMGGMETEKRKMEMVEIGNGNGNAPWKCANRWRAVLRMRKVVLRKTPRTAWRWYCVEMVLCAAMEKGTEGFVVITCVLL